VGTSGGGEWSFHRGRGEEAGHERQAPAGLVIEQEMYGIPDDRELAIRQCPRNLQCVPNWGTEQVVIPDCNQPVYGREHLWC
jgi:hypothetical protein